MGFFEILHLHMWLSTSLSTVIVDMIKEVITLFNMDYLYILK